MIAAFWLISSMPFDSFWEDFNRGEFTERVLGFENEELSASKKEEFASLFERKLHQQLDDGQWRQSSPWRKTNTGLMASLFHPKHSHVEVKIIKNPRTKNFIDIKFISALSCFCLSIIAS